MNTQDRAARGVATSTSGVSIARGVAHDPAIVKANGRYYIFGTHLAWLVSDDLVNWRGFRNNLSDDYETIFADIWNGWSRQPSNPDVKGNMWAPDVFWNRVMRKWCMVMSINGADYRSAIVLLVADDIEGDWTYVGPIVYSGFDASNVGRTDVPKVLGDGADLSRYASLTDTRINAIDPSVEEDGEGGLWMTFGSWFGGMWMLRLDPATGLRDYATTYETVADASDAYCGVKLGGGYGNSGEGSYLLRANGHWYLFVSYGNLWRTGGYQIRMFRSASGSITGPYVDEHGNTAVSTRALADNWRGDIGVKLMGSVRWRGGAGDHIEVAQGHNSAFVDDDGAMYIVYHTRFADTGEMHQVRVRELLPTADGWLVAAPYEYTGVKAADSRYDAASVAGDYEFVIHEPDVSFEGVDGGDGETVGVAGGEAGADAGPDLDLNPDSSPNLEYRGVERPAHITLSEDGRVSGDATGTWRLDASDGTGGMTITLDGVEYHGAFDKLPRDREDRKDVMAFSVIGDNRCAWGSRW